MCHSVKDWAGPIATVFAAIAAVSVTAYFAWHQKKIAKEKLRLDLYDRRFEIFSSIFGFYDAMISWTGTPEQIEARRRFFRAYQESCFLFANESGIADLLKTLNDAGAAVIGFKEHYDHYRSDPHNMIGQINKSMEIQTKTFEERLAKLRSAVHKYLDFSKI